MVTNSGEMMFMVVSYGNEGWTDGQWLQMMADIIITAIMINDA